MPDAITELLTRGVDEVIDKAHLEKRLRSGEKLRIKLGTDPTSPNLHLGRSIPLLKLRDFQELGHQIVFIIGDFTGVIGDTSDKETERPMLTREVVESNMKTYAEQAGKILDMDKCEVHYNSTGLANLTYADICRQADSFSVAEFIARDNIFRRLEANKRVSLREMLYPLMQGYDSVVVKADVEVGGTDQRFNLLAGRTLQAAYGQEPQDIITNPLILGTDGRKMSSSWGNTINLTDSPNDMYGKAMTIPDNLIVTYGEMTTRLPLAEVQAWKKAMDDGANPRDFKMKLGKELVRMYHGAEEASAAEQFFIDTFAKKQTPTDMPDLAPTANDIVTVLVEAGFAKSRGEAKRDIEGGGVKVNEEKVGLETSVKSGDIVQKGKRFFVKIK